MAAAVEDGPVRLGIVGLADFSVAVDGTSVAAGELRTGPEDDHAAAVLHPPTTVVDIPISGDTVVVAVTFHPVPGAIPDALSLGVGLPPTVRDADELIAEAAAAAAAAEIAVVVVSTSSEVESEGFDRSSLSLPGAAGRPGPCCRGRQSQRPSSSSTPAPPCCCRGATRCAAILAMWFPGQEFGHALARASCRVKRSRAADCR